LVNSLSSCFSISSSSAGAAPDAEDAGFGSGAVSVLVLDFSG